MPSQSDNEKNIQQQSGSQIFCFAEAVYKQREAEERLLEMLLGKDVIAAMRDDLHQR
jgi:hypothetical protein